MSQLSYKQGNLKVAIEKLKALTTSAEEKVEVWQDLQLEEISAHQTELEKFKDLLESKITTLDTFTGEFNAEVDLLEDDKEIKKADDVIAAVMAAIGEANEVTDLIAYELKRCEKAAGRNRQAPVTPSTVYLPPATTVTQQPQGQRWDIPRIPKFKGNRWEFENFWTMFQTFVHSSDQPKLLKFNFLIQLLEGEPKELIARYKLSEDNYERALDHLEKKYNNREDIISDLTNKLYKDKSESNTIPDQRKLYERVFIICSQLQDLKENIETRMFKDAIVQKFSKKIQEEIFRRKLDTPTDDWTLNRILEDLEKVIKQEEELFKLIKSAESERERSNHKNPGHKTTTDKFHSRENKSPYCLFCKKEGHWGSDCRTHPDPKERLEMIRTDGRCVKCLKIGHSPDKCDRRNCRNCDKSHHYSLCFKKMETNGYRKYESFKKKDTGAPSKQEAEKDKQKKANGSGHTVAVTCRLQEEMEREEAQDWTSSVAFSKQKESPAAIPTVQAKAWNPKLNDWDNLSIMIDTGADTTYISRQIVERWNLPDLGEKEIWFKRFKEPIPERGHFMKTQITLMTDQDNKITVNPYVTTDLVGQLRRTGMSESDFQYIKEMKIKLNQDALKTDVEPDIIIGCDYIPEIIPSIQERLPSGITLLDTVFGKTTFGKPDRDEPEEETEYISYQFSIIEETDTAREREEEQRRETKMKTNEEFTGPVAEEMAENDRKVVKFFKETVEKRGTKYYSRLPFKPEIESLPDNWSITEKRLCGLVKQHSTEVLETMDKVMKDQIEKGFLEKVDKNTPTKNPIHYNPLQAVLTPHKTTTKCRMVVDGGSHFKGKPSLNDMIYQGPSILPDITDMLTRLRSGATMITADVEKAFLQVFLHEDDRDVTRILWLEDIYKPPTPDNIAVYRYTRVLFGLNVSPYLLATTIQHHLGQSENIDLANQILNNTYVDNVILTTDESTEGTLDIIKFSKETFNEMGMNLRDYRTSSEILNQLIPEQDRSQEVIMKVLGIEWNSETDNLRVFISMEHQATNSRRTVSSAIASNFDPTGNLVPLILPMKLFQRNLWDDEYQWDTKITTIHEEQWKMLVDQCNGYSRNISRNVIEKSKSNTLVTFTDASKDATACCIYIVNNLGANIIFGKSRVKPLKESWTVPKLEMQALKMGVSKTRTVLEALMIGQIKVDKIVILTDSTIALSWLKQKPGVKEVGIFINNRLKSIHQDTKAIQDKQIPVQFGHVATEDNPADHGTRGLDRDQLDMSNWWHGPSSLKQDQKNWSKIFGLFEMENESEIHVVGAIKTVPDDQENIFKSNVTKSYGKMKRIAAYCLKFIQITIRGLNEDRRMKMTTTIPALQVDNTPGKLTPEQIKEGEQLLIMDHQKMIPPKHLKEWGNLGIIRNSKGLLVCRGRLEKAELSEEAREPILISPKSDLAEQIIRDSHGRFHGSLEQTMDKVRRRFWIPKLRQQAKQIIAKCVPCQRMIKRPCRYPDMAHLPATRVQITRPFGTTGLDNFGPIPVRNEDGTEGQVYGTIFTCAVTRLIHVEVVQNASALQFLQAFRRFSALKGVPDKVISDNGTNFVLGEKIIQQAMDMSQNELHNIKWKFITPYSPWKGGFYERMVRSVKHAFLKANRKNKLTVEELQTVFHEIAAAINSRPLTFIEDDINSGQALRPMDFISPEMKITIPLEDVMDITEDYLPSTELNSMETKLQTVKALKASVLETKKTWKIWQDKYLAELREHHKNRMDKKRGSKLLPTIGQVVLLCEEDQPRNSWRMCRVQKLNQSSDGVIRDIDILIENGKTLNRSINQIVPLELDEEQDEEIEENENPEGHSVGETEGREDNSKRYNLRERKPVKNSEVNTICQSSAISRIINSNLIMLTLLCLVGYAAATETKSKVICTNQGLRILGQYKSFNACIKEYCTQYPRFELRHTETAEIWIPPELKIAPHHGTIKIQENGQMTIWEIDCPAVKYCDTIDCTICWTNILNPECHMNFAILGLGVVIFLALMLFHLICNVPVKLGTPFKMLWTILTWMTRILANTMIKIIGKMKFWRNQPTKRRAKWREILVIVYVIAASMLLPTIQGCQEIDILTQLQTICQEKDKTACRVYTEEVINLNQGKNEACIRLNKNGTTFRDIRIKLIEGQYVCEKQTMIFTKDVELRTWSVKRCPSMGECTNEKCSKINKSSIVSDLHEVNHLVGVTGCSESCGGPGCGCFYISSGCLFYRIYAKPRREGLMEIFKCMDYRTQLKIEVKSTTLRNKKNTANQQQLTIPIGGQAQFEDITFTVDTINSFPTSITNTWFIRNGSSIATWTQDKWPSFQCNQDNNCTLEDRCTCYPAQNEMICSCEEDDVKSHFTDINKHLPIQEGHWKLEQFQDHVVAKTDTAATTITLKLKSRWETILYKTAESCEVSVTHAIGCYACTTGATAEIWCKSERADTTANVECSENEVFAVECTTEGKKSTIKFFSDTAKFQTRCRIDCGGKKSVETEITGVLKYSASIWTSFYRMIQGNTTIYNEINLPDVGHLIECYMSYMKTVAIVIAIVLLIFVTTYAVITRIGIKCFMAVYYGIISIICLPFKLIRRLKNRGHEHLHILIVIPIITALISPVFSTILNTETSPHSIHTPLFSGQSSLSQLVLPCPLFSQSSSLTQFPFKTLTISVNPDKKRIFTGKTMQRQSKVVDQETNKKDKAPLSNAETIQAMTKAMEEWKNMKEEEKRAKMVDRDFMFNMDQKLNAICQYLGIPLTNSPPASPNGDSVVPEAVQFEEVEAGNGQEEDPMPRDSSPRASSPSDSTPRASSPRAALTRASSPQTPSTQAPSPQDPPPRLQSKVEAVVDKNNYKMRKLEKNPRKGTTTCVFCKDSHYSDICPVVPKADDRRTIAMKKNRCFQCLLDDKKGHPCKEKPCHYCRRTGHHSALCLRAINKWMDKEHRKHRQEDKTSDNYHRRHQK